MLCLRACFVCVCARACVLGVCNINTPSPSPSPPLAPSQVLWFHAKALPQIYALSNPKNATTLAAPHPEAPVDPPLPVGVTVDADPLACDAALQANPKLEPVLSIGWGRGGGQRGGFW